MRSPPIGGGGAGGGGGPPRASPASPAPRRSLDLPPMTDPGYEDALSRAQGEITASALAETFLFSALLLAVALGVAFLLRRRPRGGGAGPGGGHGRTRGGRG